MVWWWTALALGIPPDEILSDRELTEHLQRLHWRCESLRVLTSRADHGPAARLVQGPVGVMPNTPGWIERQVPRTPACKIVLSRVEGGWWAVRLRAGADEPLTRSALTEPVQAPSPPPPPRESAVRSLFRSTMDEVPREPAPWITAAPVMLLYLPVFPAGVSLRWSHPTNKRISVLGDASLYASWLPHDGFYPTVRGMGGLDLDLKLNPDGRIRGGYLSTRCGLAHVASPDLPLYGEAHLTVGYRSHSRDGVITEIGLGAAMFGLEYAFPALDLRLGAIAIPP